MIPVLAAPSRLENRMRRHMLQRIDPRRVWILAITAACLGGSAPAAGLPPPPVPDENPITPAKRVLGKVLFWDEQLSSDNTVSCGTCHMPEASGADTRSLRHPGFDGVFNTPDDAFGSPGVIASTPTGDYAPDFVYGFGVQATGRSAPPAIMAAYFTELFWDGRASSIFTDPQTGAESIAWFGALESQAVGPPLSAVEMAHAGRNWGMIVEKIARVRPLALGTDIPPDVADALAAAGDYPALFAAAFGTPEITADRIAKAIATYERTLVPDQTPWDRFEAGDAGALTPDQVRGMVSFEVASCNFCHTPPTFMDDLYSNIGVRPPLEDKGRQRVTGAPQDLGRFKTPSLRNAGLRGRFMHNGAMTSLDEVLAFYAQTPGAPPRFTQNLDPAIELMNLDPVESPFIVDFIAHALTDPRVAARQFPFDRPTLFSLRAGTHLAVLTDSGVPGSGGTMPGVIANAPPMIGNEEFRFGVHGGLGGATAVLALSPTPPVGGKIIPQASLGPVDLAPGGAGDGYATLQLPILPAMFQDGQVVYMQWLIQDAGAPAGEAASPAVRVTFFCPRGGCAAACDPDVNLDGNADQDDVAYLVNVIAGGPNPAGIDPDFNRDGNVDQDDYAALVNVIAGAPCP
jgi:cytochrome c peroxidase